MKGRAIIFALFMSVSLFITSQSDAVTLPVPEIKEIQQNWCWASDVAAIVNYFGGTVNQCQVANSRLELVNQSPRPDCCTSPSDPACNIGNYLYGQRNSVDALLNYYSVLTQPGIARPLSPDEIWTEISSGRPFIIGWDPYNNFSGHVVVSAGMVRQQGQPQNPLVQYMDSMYGIIIATNAYNWVVNNIGGWHETLRMNQGKVPLPDIRVNGVDGVYYTNSTQNLNITANLDARGYTTGADWWVMLSWGQYYYLNQYGNWVTTPTPYKQGPLQNTGFQVFSGTLPAGYYSLYFIVDLTQDGVQNDPYYYDSLTIVVQW